MFDFKKIKQFYNISRSLRMQDIQALYNASKRYVFEPNDYIIEEGSRNKKFYYINKGLVRRFTINDKGEEITLSLHWENQPVANPEMIFYNQPSRFYYQAIEPTEVYGIDYDLAQTIIAKNPQMEGYRKRILQRLLKDASERIEDFILLSPEERYLKFIETKPDIVNRVPGKYIANILGITPVSLSRIRKRIAARRDNS